MDNRYVQAIFRLARDGLGMSHTATAKVTLQIIREKSPCIDIIQAALNDYIDRYRSLSFENFSMDIRVRPSEQGHAIAMEYDNITIARIGVDMYRFVAAGYLRRRMLVRPVRGDVLILYNGRWQPVEAYLDALKAEPAIRAVIDDEPRAMTWWRQENWWRSNGKVFRLLDLPAELRDRIYHFVLVKPVNPYPRSRARRLGYPGQIYMAARNPTAALMRVSRQINAEASHVLYRDTPFIISHKQVLHEVITNPLLASNIRHLHLSLSHAAYCSAFGFKFNDILDHSSPYARSVEALRVMRLTSLEICIAAPSMVSERAWSDRACQRTVVGWIFEAVWPYIRGHAFTFCGFIKNSQKEMFETYGVQERAVVDEWQSNRAKWGLREGTLKEYDEFIQGWESDEPGGVRVDGGEGEADEWLMKRPVVQENVGDGRLNIPRAPICFCQTQCSVEAWDPAE